ncbi:MAG: ribosome biogenesis GTP-binding protein YihA/YsxC [bacterium]
MKVKNSEFVKSASHPSQCPDEGLPEVAFAGRSNVGKSSLINSLLGRKNLARTSGSPGHTRTLNFYRINNRYMFADLPGYGYAKAPREERKSWKNLVEGYLRTRSELCAVVIILDMRREPGQEEIDLIGFLTAEGITPLLVATKADKIGKTKRVKPLRAAAGALGMTFDSILQFSARTGEGRDALWKRLVELMDQK